MAAKRIVLWNVRISFPNIWEMGGSYNRADCDFLLSPEEDAEQIATLKAAAVAVIKEQWAGKLKDMSKLKAYFLHSGDEKEDTAGYAGQVFVSAHADKQLPKVVNRLGAEITEADGIIYSGCRVNAYLDITAIDNKFGKFCSAYLMGVQFFADDESLGGGAPMSIDEFEIYADDEDPLVDDSGDETAESAEKKVDPLDDLF